MRALAAAPARYRWLAAFSWLALLSSVPRVASAHGREPSLGALSFDPTDPDHLVVRATWAFLESHDGGATFQWRCAVAVGYERTTEDPPIVIPSDHRVLAGIFDGLARGDEAGCGYEPVRDPEVDGLYVIDMVRDPLSPRAVWAITSPGDRANTLVRSSDDGATWETVGTPHPTALLERVRVAPSDPSRVYVSGAVPRRGTEPRRALVFASSDGGRTFTETEVPLEGEERNLHVLAVDPMRPERILVRVVRLVTDLVPERLLISEDGGRTFATAASLLEITGVTFSEDGSQVWAGSWDGGFLRSDARGAAGTFVPVAGQEMRRVRCLAVRPGTGELWVCADDLRDEFALARSTDGGSTLERVWGFEDVTIDTGCDACSEVGGMCPGYWPDVVFDLGLSPDAGMDLDGGSSRTCDGGEPMDAGEASDVGPARPANCGCRATRTSGSAWLAALAVGLAVHRRARRTRPIR